MATVATTYDGIRARKHRSRLDAPHIILFVVMCLFGLAMLFPFIWMVLTSLKPETEVVAFPPKLIPQVWSIDSYVNIWQRIPFGRFFANSLVFAGGVTLISLTLDSMTAFALSRLALPGRCARRDFCAAKCPILKADVHLNGGVPARIEDLAGPYVDDDGHAKF